MSFCPASVLGHMEQIGTFVVGQATTTAGGGDVEVIIAMVAAKEIDGKIDDDDEMIVLSSIKTNVSAVCCINIRVMMLCER
jgi:hypothetical protein